MQITIDVPESAFSSIRITPDEYVKEMKKAAAIKWYELKKISQNKASEICGLSRSEFIAALNEYKVSILQDDERTLREELND